LLHELMHKGFSPTNVSSNSILFVVGMCLVIIFIRVTHKGAY
jgi:hypothetical protein